MDMTGYLCPELCGSTIHLLSTTNELRYYCPKCDKRFATYADADMKCGCVTWERCVCTKRSGALYSDPPVCADCRKVLPGIKCIRHRAPPAGTAGDTVTCPYCGMIYYAAAFDEGPFKCLCGNHIDLADCNAASED